MVVAAEHENKRQRTISGLLTIHEPEHVAAPRGASLGYLCGTTTKSSELQPVLVTVEPSEALSPWSPSVFYIGYWFFSNCPPARRHGAHPRQVAIAFNCLVEHFGGQLDVDLRPTRQIASSISVGAAKPALPFQTRLASAPARPGSVLAAVAHSR